MDPRPPDVADQLAHELKNPLAGIRGLASTGLAAYDALTDDERREFLRLIVVEADRQERVIEQASMLIRIREGSVIYDLEQQPVAALLAPFADEPRVEVADVDDDLTVLCDLRFIRGVLQELVANAVSYSPPGSPIEIDAVRDGATVRIRVLDHGPMPLEDVDPLEAFTNARPPGYEDVPGAGLGLYLADAHVAAHGGRIRMAAGEGGGTMLTFALPKGGEP